MVKGRVGKITAFDGSSGEYLVMLGSKNERCSESDLERLRDGKKSKPKGELIRKKKPKAKSSI